MFEWFINVQGALKGRLPIKMFQSKSQQIYDEWLKQQPEPVSEQDQLKFSKHWMKDYNVSLCKLTKKYAINKEDEIIQIKDYCKNIWMVRKYFINKYGVDSTVINRDQMPLHTNESANKNTFFKIRSLCKRKLPAFKRKSYLLHTAL